MKLGQKIVDANGSRKCVINKYQEKITYLISVCNFNETAQNAKDNSSTLIKQYVSLKVYKNMNIQKIALKSYYIMISIVIHIYSKVRRLKAQRNHL